MKFNNFFLISKNVRMKTKFQGWFFSKTNCYFEVASKNYLQFFLSKLLSLKIIFFSPPRSARELKLRSFDSETKYSSGCTYTLFSKKSSLTVCFHSTNIQFIVFTRSWIRDLECGQWVTTCDWFYCKLLKRNDYEEMTTVILEARLDDVCSDSESLWRNKMYFSGLKLEWN